MITTVIADDEALARRTLRTLVAADPAIRIVGECRDGEEVVAIVRDLRPDLMFLDIQMPGLDGFGALARTAPADLPVIVFVTAHEQHALCAFDVDAVDYVLKPFTDERFARALHRAKTVVDHRRGTGTGIGTEAAPPPPPALADGDERIAVRDGRGVELVEPATIDWIGALGYYAELHVAGRCLLLREPLQDLEVRLDPARFVRIHRSTIVNATRVRRLERLAYGDYEVVLADGTRLRMSRARRTALERLLG